MEGAGLFEGRYDVGTRVSRPWFRHPRYARGIQHSSMSSSSAPVISLLLRRCAALLPLLTYFLKTSFALFGYNQGKPR